MRSSPRTLMPSPRLPTRLRPPAPPHLHARLDELEGRADGGPHAPRPRPRQQARQEVVEGGVGHQPLLQRDERACGVWVGESGWKEQGFGGLRVWGKGGDARGQGGEGGIAGAEGLGERDAATGRCRHAPSTQLLAASCQSGKGQRRHRCWLRLSGDTPRRVPFTAIWNAKAGLRPRNSAAGPSCCTILARPAHE